MVAAAPMGRSEWSWEGGGRHCGLRAPPRPLSSGCSAELTMLTPPELSALHMPSTGARPTVAPWKVRPLGAEHSVIPRDPRSWLPCPPATWDQRYPREQLCRVVWPLHTQSPTPLQKGPERGVGVRCDAAEVLLGPHFQPGQHHLNVQCPENLRTG
jgi:hypothetical protein